MKIMIVNSKISQKSSSWFYSLPCYYILVLDFILYFVTIYIIWESTLYISHDHRVKQQIHYASLEELKKSYDKQFTAVTTHKMFKTITIKNVIIHWNLLYALKIWNCLNFVQKRRLFFFAKSSWYLLRSDV